MGQLEALQSYIDAWQANLPSGDHWLDDPFAISLQGQPVYLPLLQPKNGYSHYGKHMRSKHVLGLSRQATWIEDGRAGGKVSWDYGTTEQAFGALHFPLAPLKLIQRRYPLVASLIWDQRAVDDVAAQYVQKAQRLATQVAHLPNHASESREVIRMRQELSATCGTLGRLETPETLEWLTQALSSRSAVLREMALLGFSRVTWEETASHTTQDSKKAQEREEPTTVAYGHLLSHLDLFTPFLNDASLAVRRMAVAAIRTVGNQGAVETLVALIDNPTAVTSDAIDALVGLHASAADAPLHTLLSAQEHPQGAQHEPGEESILLSATLALQTYWRPSDVDLIRMLLLHPASSVRAAAAYVAGSLRLRDVADDVLRRFEEDTTPGVRVEAGYTLVAFGDRRIVPLLRQRAEHAATPYMGLIDQNPHVEGVEAKELLLMLERRRDE